MSSAREWSCVSGLEGCTSSGEQAGRLCFEGDNQVGAGGGEDASDDKGGDGKVPLGAAHRQGRDREGGRISVPRSRMVRVGRRGVLPGDKTEGELGEEHQA